MAEQKKAKDYRKTKGFRILQQALLENLRSRGLDQEACTDKVEEYMNFWVLQKQLDDDISQRGLTVTDDRGRQTENRSVSLKIQVSKQMLALFNAMGFKPSDFMGLGGDDEL